MLRIPWPAKVTNAKVRTRIGLNDSLDAMILKQKLSYFGHVIRGNSLEKSILLGMASGARGRGRPRRRWLNEVVGNLGPLVWTYGRHKKQLEIVVDGEDLSWKSLKIGNNLMAHGNTITIYYWTKPKISLSPTQMPNCLNFYIKCHVVGCLESTSALSSEASRCCRLGQVICAAVPHMMEGASGVG